jgi:hypothetical protein
LPVTEDRPARRSESHAAKRQRELTEKTPEDALRRGLEVQHAAAASGARMLLTVYFGTPNMLITLWFGFVYGTNPPLGILII